MIYRLTLVHVLRKCVSNAYGKTRNYSFILLSEVASIVYKFILKMPKIGDYI